MTMQAIIAVCLWTLCFATAAIVIRTPAVLASGLVFGWLFLPNFNLVFPGLPDFDKPTLVSMVSVGLVLLIPRGHLSFASIKWMDLPVIGMTFCALPSSVVNGLGWYDGLSVVYTNFWVWTAPYLIGRTTFGKQTSAIDLIRITILGTLIYAAFCLYEIRMSPRLHWMIYGMLPRDGQNYFSQAVRYGFWRPTVFMEHGLALAIHLSIVTTLARWAQVSGAIPRLAGLSMRTVAAILGLTTVMCVSSGAIIMLAVGWTISSFCGKPFGRWALFLTTLVCFIYPISRMLGSESIVASVVTMTEVAAEHTGERRTKSFQFRVENEEIMLKNWQSSPVSGRARFFRDSEIDKSAITDSFWIIMLGKFGLCGWFFWTAMIVIPVIVFWFRATFSNFGAPPVVMGLSLGATIFALDGLLNAMINPIFVVMSGASLALLAQRTPAVKGGVSERWKTQTSHRVPRSLWPFHQSSDRDLR